MVTVFKVEFQVRYKGGDFEKQTYDVVSKDGAQAIKKAGKLVPKSVEWDDENDKHHSDKLMKAWPCGVTLVVETDD